MNTANAVRIGIIIGSIRDGRRGGNVGRWVHGIATRQGAEPDATKADATGPDTRPAPAEFALLDLREFSLPLLTDATVPGAAERQYPSEEARRWSRAIDACDGFVFVTPEYNHGVPGAFKNAVDTLEPEWRQKAVAFVSYGSGSGLRSVEQWRQILASFDMSDIRQQVSMSTSREFEGAELRASERREEQVQRMLVRLVEQSRLMRELRIGHSDPARAGLSSEHEQ